MPLICTVEFARLSFLLLLIVVLGVIKGQSSFCFTTLKKCIVFVLKLSFLLVLSMSKANKKLLFSHFGSQVWVLSSFLPVWELLFSRVGFGLGQTEGRQQKKTPPRKKSEVTFTEGQCLLTALLLLNHQVGGWWRSLLKSQTLWETKSLPLTEDFISAEMAVLWSPD